MITTCPLSPQETLSQFVIPAKSACGGSSRGITQIGVIAMLVSKSPLTPLWQRGELRGINSKSPPFVKGDKGGFYEIPKDKHQITNKYQIPIFNDQNEKQVWNFETGDPPAGWGVQAKRGEKIAALRARSSTPVASCQRLETG